MKELTWREKREQELRAAGRLYNPMKTGDLNWAKARRLCGEFNDWKTNDARRREILPDLLGGVGENSTIVQPFQVDLGSFVFIGNHSFINMNGLILDKAPVTIGDNVYIGPNVQLVTPVHPMKAEYRNTDLERAEPITIEDDYWLASGVTVLPGVTIHKGSVIGAGSVVTRDIPADSVAVGVPCRVIGTVDELARPEEAEELTAYFQELGEDQPC